MISRQLIAILSIVTVLTTGFCGTLSADTTTPTSDIAAPSSYEVQPQDILAVAVIGFPDLTVPQVSVLQDGTISLPLIGSVNVLNETPQQIQDKLTKLWSKYVVNPSVSVAMFQQHPEYVTITGWVLKPGILPYHTDYHVIEALADDGGVLNGGLVTQGTNGPTGAPAAGDLSKVTVTDSSGQSITLDLTHPATKAGTTVDVLLNPGDVVYVPQLRDEFSVVGQVAHPGSYPYLENMTVLDALTTTGGVLSDAALGDATLLHNGQEEQVNLDALLRHGDLSQNFKLAAGDRLTVPQGDRTYVYGAVNHPGFYTYVPGDHVLDALNAAGGPQSAGIGGQGTPDLAKINLIRVDKETKVAEVQRVNLQAFLSKGDERYNVAIQPGDVLYVPTKGHKFSFSDLTGPLNGIQSLVYVDSIVH